MRECRGATAGKRRRTSLEIDASALALSGVVLAALVDRRWLANARAT